MKERIFWTGVGLVGGLALRAGLEQFVVTSNWPEHLRGFVWGSLQDPIISVTSWLIPGGILGLAGFFGPDAFRLKGSARFR